MRAKGEGITCGLLLRKTTLKRRGAASGLSTSWAGDWEGGEGRSPAILR